MCRWAENGPKTVPKPNSIPTGRSRRDGERRERERGSSGARVETVPSPPRRRRTFPAAEKLRIVQKADACVASGERGALEAMMREEGIYSSLLAAWRRELRAAGAEALKNRKPGRKPKLDARDKALAQLQRRNAELERRLHVAEALIELQKKAYALLGIALPEVAESAGER